MTRFGDGRVMRRPGHLALILCLVLTGIGLGAARGTIARAGQVVLCTGHGVVVVDHPDGPPRTQVCPDMALSLLAALQVPLVSPSLSRDPVALVWPVLARHAPGRQAPLPAARDPPFRQISEAKPV
ncbi:hypothetical protein [Paracoccus aerius]|uniref:DUF2946 domain-containing protein n=1 Tax=Paracoccus aerius TaxID=1915382 RepID=A0ABS1S544_9RHOB|nr:hypothetical protein [Paracoccus aerius]MBL3673269.1 hypothetical protein [Paracoccus aerius]GHG17252.1 hypothetical protein GCM10017322_12420 [Paracoccus aerius]